MHEQAHLRSAEPGAENQNPASQLIDWWAKQMPILGCHGGLVVACYTVLLWQWVTNIALNVTCYFCLIGCKDFLEGDANWAIVLGSMRLTSFLAHSRGSRNSCEPNLQISQLIHGAYCMWYYVREISLLKKFAFSQILKMRNNYLSKSHRKASC